MVKKVEFTTTLDVPSGILLYDLGSETLICKACQGNRSLHMGSDIIPGFAKEFDDFLRLHGKCIWKKLQKAAREPAEPDQGCRNDYRADDGSGPHECGKATNHRGKCGPG